MVSFHCDACTDVVKKPKLDNHYGQCRSSFTCIDCSKTFQGPAQWKGHTSCVTEAEKYQKSLYAGPKNGSRPTNGHQRNFVPKTTNTPGKYPQSLGTHSGWSRRQYIYNCASGANSTPLGSPRRMSPVDPSAVELSLSSANAASVTEQGEGKTRDSGATAASHTPNGAEPKEKKRKRKHDHTPRDHNGKDVAADEPPANGPSEKRRGVETDEDGSLPKTQPPTEGDPQNSGDKKVKKRKKQKKEEAQSKQENEEHVAPPEPVAPHGGGNSKDEKKAKKRKRKEKREEDAQATQGDTELEPLASHTDGAQRKRKKRKDKEEKAVVEVVGAD